VEDEPKVAAALQEGLAAESYSDTLSNSGEEGFFLASTEQYNPIILDIMLPRRSGIELLSDMRQRGMQTCVLLLTARDTVQDHILGHDSGSDDHLAKPFALDFCLDSAFHFTDVIFQIYSIHLSSETASGMYISIPLQRFQRQLIPNYQKQT
jgi:CheY-like chemotaxis protein